MMKPKSLFKFGRTVVSGICAVTFLNLQTVGWSQSVGHITFTADKAPPDSAARKSDSPARDYSPAYLAERLGVAQRATKLEGATIKDMAGRKNGKLQEMIVDLNS